jgi:hypothetical protein
VVDVTNAYNSIADILQAMGINDVKRYFNNPEKIKPVLDDMANQPPQPDPAMVIAQMEMKLRDVLATADNVTKMTIHQDEMDVKAKELELETQKLGLDAIKLKIVAAKIGAEMPEEEPKDDGRDVALGVAERTNQSVMQALQNMTAALASKQAPAKRKIKKVNDEYIMEELE